MAGYDVIVLCVFVELWGSCHAVWSFVRREGGGSSRGEQGMCGEGSVSVLFLCFCCLIGQSCLVWRKCAVV